MFINTPVIVLKSFPYSETSIIARCFSRDKGKISFIVKGAYSKKASKSAEFQTMTYLDVIYKYNPKRELQILYKVNFKESWPKILTDIRAITFSMTILEITDKILSFEDPYPDLFKSLVNVLREYNNKILDQNILFWYYECSLLSYLGFHPDLNDNTFLSVRNINYNLNPQIKSILVGLLKKDIYNFSKIRISSKNRKIISKYLWSLLCFHFEGLENIKSMSVARKILKDINF